MDRDRHYRSYDYLESVVDYRAFELSPELHRVPSEQPTLDCAQRDRATALLQSATVISLHDHPTVRPASPADFRDYRRQGREVTGFEGLGLSGLDAVVDGMMAGAAFMTSGSGWKWTDVVLDLGMRQCDIAHQDKIRVVHRASDIPALKAAGRVGIVFAIESAAPIENELDRLDVLFGLGVRVIGLTYNAANALGSGLAEKADSGLTKFGRAAIRRMNQIGLVIDLSHTADRTSLEAIEVSEHPLTISHTGARGLWDIGRLKPDDVLRECAGAGGVVGIGAVPNTTVSSSRPRHSLDSVMEHFEYCVNLVGFEHVGFGPDVNFGDHVAWNREFAGGVVQLPSGIEPVEYVNGIENPVEAFRNITSWLVAHGYTDEQIVAVIGGNALRVFQSVWPDPALDEGATDEATSLTKGPRPA